MLAKLAAARLAAPAAAMPAAFVDLRPTYSRDATDEGAPAPAGHPPLGLGEAFALQLRPPPPPPQAQRARASRMDAALGLCGTCVLRYG